MLFLGHDSSTLILTTFWFAASSVLQSCAVNESKGRSPEGVARDKVGTSPGEPSSEDLSSSGEDELVNPQSGSEFFEPEPGALLPGATDSADQEALYRDCPCERLEGAVPMLGVVKSWEAALLDLEVSEVLLADPPGTVPTVGQHVLGVYTGRLPCYAGAYEPQPGDEVVAYLVQEQELPGVCCFEHCNARCAVDGGDVSDACLSECQGEAEEECKAKRAERPIAGQLLLAPFKQDGALLGASADHEFRVAKTDLPTIFAGGDSCGADVGNAEDVLPDAQFSTAWAVRVSCGDSSDSPSDFVVEFDPPQPDEPCGGKKCGEPCQPPDETVEGPSFCDAEGACVNQTIPECD